MLRLNWLSNRRRVCESVRPTKSLSPHGKACDCVCSQTVVHRAELVLRDQRACHSLLREIFLVGKMPALIDQYLFLLTRVMCSAIHTRRSFMSVFLVRRCGALMALCLGC